MRNTRTAAGLCLLLVAAAYAEVALVQDRLSADMLVWVNSRWQQTEKLGITESDFVFYRFGAPVGLTGRLSDEASFRVSVDAGWYQRTLDLYVDVSQPEGFGIRAGQFTPALGFEARTHLKALKFIDYSLVKNDWKPWDQRDVGVMGRYQNTLFEVEAAVVNGNGRNEWLYDDNKWKDFCARFFFKGLEDAGYLVALRGYYGRTGSDGVVFKNAALELDARKGDVRVTGELQAAAYGTDPKVSFYTQATWAYRGLVEPAARLHMSFGSGEVRSAGVTAGINFPICGDDLKVMLNYDLRRQSAPGLELDYTSQRVLLQLQAAL